LGACNPPPWLKDQKVAETKPEQISNMAYNILLFYELGNCHYQ
jgi:hypothetical protein